MTAHPPTSTWSRSSVAALVGATLVAVAAGLFVLAATSEPRQEASPPAGIATTAAVAVPAAQPLGRSAPVRLRIPELGLDTTLGTSGTTATGALAAPAYFDHASWFSPGASPGEAGAAVILGHVDSADGPAVFFHLGELTAGAEILVTRQDGSVTRFVVDRTEVVAKDRFPTDRVFAADDAAHLRLITCGGSFDRDERRYLSNVIVSATMTEVVRPPAAIGH
ncbi:class F sortase [Nocardia sp. NPDC003979]